MRDEGKDHNAYQHDDEQETRPAPGMEVAESFDPIGDQCAALFEGKDRLMLRAVILKNALDLLE